MLSHADLTVERWPGTQLTEEDEEIPHLQPTETFVQSSHALMQCMTGKEQAVLFKASSVAIMSSLGQGTDWDAVAIVGHLRIGSTHWQNG